MEQQGARETLAEIVEAVAIAALSAVATGLVNWGLERAKARAQAKPPDAAGGNTPAGPDRSA